MTISPALFPAVTVTVVRRKENTARPRNQSDWRILRIPPAHDQRNKWNIIPYHTIPSGAIIGDGDRKRAPFLVLGLAPWYGTIFLVLEQIAPSPAGHARTCCEDFRGWRAGKMSSEISEIFYTFSPLLNTFMSAGILLKYFRRKLLQSGPVWVRKDGVEFRCVRLYITDQVVFRCFFYENFTLLHSKFHICSRLTAFP